MYSVHPVLILQSILSKTNLHKTMKIQYGSIWIYEDINAHSQARFYKIYLWQT
jgi:hypothetical protein